MASSLLLLGATDVAAANRSLAPVPRGLHEIIIDPTTTTLSCAPAGLVLGGGAATCTATVTDTAAAPTPPSGAVAFAGDGPGAFGDNATCALAATGSATAGCRLTYTASAVGSGSHTVVAAYGGDGGHKPSQGSTALQVSAPPVAPNTTLKKKPMRKTAEGLARFTFASNQPGSSFQCKLDKKPFKSCRPPFQTRVKHGSHTFRVRAVSAAGVPDSTPAVFHWKVF